jgi:plasmid stabilization system protein ParE
VTLPVVWLPEADADRREALAWYKDIHSDLGVRFALAVDAVVEVIARVPGVFRLCTGKYGGRE